MKKSYQKPIITTEEILEQTSLSCNTTQDYQPNQGQFADICNTPIAKSPNWDDSCQTIVAGIGDCQSISLS